MKKPSKKKSAKKKGKMSVRLGPAGKGRRTGTEVMGPTSYDRRHNKDESKREIGDQLKK